MIFTILCLYTFFPNFIFVNFIVLVIHFTSCFSPFEVIPSFSSLLVVVLGIKMFILRLYHYTCKPYVVVNNNSSNSVLHFFLSYPVLLLSYILLYTILSLFLLWKWIFLSLKPSILLYIHFDVCEFYMYFLIFKRKFFAFCIWDISHSVWRTTYNISLKMDLLIRKFPNIF